MNTYQLAEDFRKLFEDAVDGDEAPVFGYPQLHGQSEDDFEAPANVFVLSEEPFSTNGKAAKFTLTVEVHSPSSADVGESAADAAHAARVKAVRGFLFGAASKTALRAALNDLGRWDLRGWSAAGEDPDRQGMRFLTPVRLVGTVIEVEPVVTFNFADETAVFDSELLKFA